MRVSGRLVVLVALGLTAAARGQYHPMTLPEPAPAPVRDLTPPEFLRPVEPPPEVVPTGGVYAWAEFLFLTPRQRGLDFALVDSSDNLVPAGYVQALNYQPHPGLRAGFAYQPFGHCWDIGFTYTYFHSSDSFVIAAPAGGLLYPTLTRAGLTNEATTAAASASVAINVFDLEVGRRWADDDSLVRVYGGLRGATVRERLSARYGGRDADAAEVSLRSSFEGVGPLVGAEAVGGLGGGFGVFGRANAALLTGRVRAPFSETNNGGATVYADLRDRFALTVPVVTLGIGVSYQYHGVFVRAGYEVTNWFGLFERPAFVDDFAEGKFLRQSTNLGLDGVFVQAGLTF